MGMGSPFGWLARGQRRPPFVGVSIAPGAARLKVEQGLERSGSQSPLLEDPHLLGAEGRVEEGLVLDVAAEEVGDVVHALVKIGPVPRAAAEHAVMARIDARQELDELGVARPLDRGSSRSQSRRTAAPGARKGASRAAAISGWSRICSWNPISTLASSMSWARAPGSVSLRASA